MDGKGSHSHSEKVSKHLRFEKNHDNNDGGDESEGKDEDADSLSIDAKSILRTEKDEKLSCTPIEYVKVELPSLCLPEHSVYSRAGLPQRRRGIGIMVKVEPTRDLDRIHGVKEGRSLCIVG